MNYADTEKMKYTLEESGLGPAGGLEDADVIILNTCSVRQRAEDKVLGMARAIGAIKNERPGTKVILTGCMSYRYERHREGSRHASEVDPKYLNMLRRRMPWVDSFVEIGDIAGILAAAGVRDKEPKKYLSSPQRHLSRVSANVPISSGCDNFCAYCIVPFSRREEVHRSYEEILEQVRSLVHEGYKKITLLGQNVNSWAGKRDGTEIAFPELLMDVGTIGGDFWMTFLTSHPKDLSDEMTDVYETNKKLCRYLNLPAQSGSSRILQKMNRTYTREEFLEKVGRFRKKHPDVRMSTDIIVGFPGESDEDFADTLDLLEQVGFGQVYVAEYSPRPGAASARRDDDVPPEVKAERRRVVEELQARLMQGQNDERIGRKERVLVLSNKKGETFDCQDISFERPPGPDAVGLFVDAEITQASPGGFRGRIVV